MTCIVGLVDKGKVYIGGDSAGVGNYNIHIRNDKKVFTNGDMIMGFTTSFRMGQLLEYKLKLPDHDPRVDDFKYLVTDFIDAVKKCFKDNDYAMVKNEVVLGGTWLVGYHSKLYAIHSDFQVASVEDGFDSCGCGEDIAKGAMTILVDDKKLKPEAKITQALASAAHFSAGVSGPFNIVSV